MVFREFTRRMKRCIDEVKLRKQITIRDASPEWPDTHMYNVMIDSMVAARNRLFGMKVTVPTMEQTIDGLTLAKNYFASRKKKKEVAVLALTIEILERREKMG